ncbi:hypothetical protein [Streptomyces pseudovenezuelae]|uniref:DoxX family protein n=1 Tax=Streptomyces pseudovenezuelae TaxID=67350 RepID=A0ABT6LQC1_9ACTN|nr:hypothetical protein [Streptomyces pseudovenezuelae]MDH6218520.1 hypothetical protein [Streptomyces pseudovenezuelae]
MLLLQSLGGLAELFIGMLAQARLGVVGVVLLFLIGVGIRARHNGLVFWAAALFTLLMVQA